MNSEQRIEWQLGGWSGLSPLLGWLIFLLIALVGAALTAWFYRHTLRALTWRQRTIFVTLRVAFLLLLLVCLASPMRVQRTYEADHDKRPLAVVVDHSASMTTPDQRGITRLSSALHAWKKVETDAIRSFALLRYFRFSESLHEASDLESAVNSSESGNGTHLYDSLNQVMKNAGPGGYGGIVCLTDGLDTTDETPEILGAEAAQNHCPIYFIAGQNQQSAHETLFVREMNVPGQVRRKSQFTATVLVEAHGLHERDVPLSLWQDGQSIAETRLHIRPGANLIPWTVPINSDQPGLIHLACRLGEGAEQESTAAAVRVVAQEQIHVLFYQGSLDWNCRFIDTALQGDASFQITSLYNPDLNLTRVVSPSSQPSTLTQLPDAMADLQPFQIVVLSNVYADQMSPAQQAALAGYVEGGGGLLFLVSDTTMARTFSGTELEKMLPVIFEAPPKGADDDESLRSFQELMHSLGGSNRTPEGEFASGAEATSGLDPLKGFAIPANSTHSKVAALFGSAAGGRLKNLPRFVTYARVHGLKAGAQTLAIHPDEETADKTPRALLVTQRFGQGHVTALLTDGLWRWRLSLPSTSHDPQIFWQQLFLALAGQRTSRTGLRFALQPFSASLGKTCLFRLSGAQGSGPPVITAVSPRGASRTLESQLDSSSDSWSFQFKPGEPGTWRIRAEDERGAQMETLLRVSHVSHAEELSGLPPDVDGLRKLAESTGGSLLNDGVPVTWSTTSSADLTTLVSKHSEPVWDTWIILLLALGFYVSELVWRRQAKLL